MAKKRRLSQVELFEQVIEENDLAQVKFALRHHRAKINEQDAQGVTVLQRSCFRGKLEIVRLLVENGAELEVRDEQGWTCLHYAANGGHVDVVSFLLNSFADVTAMSHDGELAIDVAAGEGIVFLVASAILRANKEHLLRRYMDGSASSVQSAQSSEGVFAPSQEEVFRASEQFLTQSFGAYLDAKFNLSRDCGKNVGRRNERSFALSVTETKLSRNVSCPVYNDPQVITASKKVPLNSFKSSFSPDVLQRFAVSDTNLNKQLDAKVGDGRAEIARVPNYFDLNNANSETWINL